MKAVLHVRIPYNKSDEFDSFIEESIQEFSPRYNKNSKRNSSKVIKNEDGTVTLKGTTTGELWTWVTTSGNAIKCWSTYNISGHSVVAIELDCSRRSARDGKNGVGIIIQAIEEFCELRREYWNVIWVESHSSEDWHNYGVTQDKEPERVEIGSVYDNESQVGLIL